MRPRTRRVRGVAFAILLACMAACTRTFVAPDIVTTNAAIFDELWKSVDQRYPSFDAKQINWDSLRTVYRPQALNATDARALQITLAALLRELHDPHVVFYGQDGQYTSRSYRGRADTIATYYNVATVISQYFSSQGYDFENGTLARMLSPTVGYLNIVDFSADDEGLRIDQALLTLSSATSIIIDVRSNPGGSYTGAIDAAGRFVRHSATFGYLRYRNGPLHTDLTPLLAEVVTPKGVKSGNRTIYLLTNSATASAAEVFTLAVRTNPDIVTIGDTTAGESGGPTSRELSTGWIYQLSEWMEFKADHTLYEGIGIAPDIVMRRRQSDDRLPVDPVIERALALARATP